MTYVAKPLETRVVKMEKGEWGSSEGNDSHAAENYLQVSS